MAVVYDPVTELAMGDPDAAPFGGPEGSSGLPTHSIEKLTDSFASCILSASGFRKVCAADGSEESALQDVAVADRMLFALFSLVFVDELRKLHAAAAGNGEDRPLCVAVGIDARPTGPALADSVIRALLGEAIGVRYLFISPAPEIMAYVRAEAAVDGFIYISASHNPIGHNGIKFGLNRGGVLEPDRAAALIHRLTATFETAASTEAAVERISAAIVAAPVESVRRVFTEAPEWKRAASRRYTSFTRRVVSGSEDPAVQGELLAALRTSMADRPIGVLGELNGSARSVGIDADFLAECGVDVVLLNNRPGRIVHRIVPEGESLEPACRELERLAESSGHFALAYVPDNDGDRGNLVCYDRGLRRARPVSAQEVFALSCVAELAWLVYSGGVTYDERGRALQKVAVAVNGPTSLRVDRIAEAFDAQVFRAEVGEANVVELSRRLRKRGYIVRILGEGSNGGNITYPAAVRDPLNTVTAMVKLLALRTTDDRLGLFDIWRMRAGLGRTSGDFELTDVIATLPRFQTTSAFERRAQLRIRTASHGLLKAEYERIFAAEWQLKREELRRRLGIHTWKEINYDGVEEKQGVGKAFRTPPERGGLKIVFKDEKGHVSAFVWMRGSGTEPVFRVMADVESSDPEDESYLLDWHVGMIDRADRAASAQERSSPAAERG
ncbi:phosphatidylglycerol lysyltransferase [Salinispira pacifica]